MVQQSLYDADALMADGGETRMTAAEEVLAFILVEVVGAPDDEAYSPNRAQVTIEAKLKELCKLEMVREDRDRLHVECSGHIAALAAKDAEIEAAHDENNRLRGLIEEAQRCLDDGPEYHSQGMGCGLEDRGITDRYDAMSHGWEQAMERVYSENIAWAKDALASALKEKADV